MTKTIWQIKLKCCDATKICEIDSEYTLDDLYPFILDSFDFDNDHMHKFFLSRNGNPYGESAEELNESLKLSDIFPRQDKRRLFLLFDFGDSWIFSISKMLKKIVYDENVNYPLVRNFTGKNPEQYPEYDDELV